MRAEAAAARRLGFSHPRRDDAQAAMDNMHNAELYGRVLRCNLAQEDKRAARGSEPVWKVDADAYTAAAGEAEDR